jgi:hypothetical protein
LPEEDGQQPQENIKKAKAALFAYLADKQPLVTRISASYRGYDDEGWVDEVRYFGIEDESIDLKDETLAGLVEELFEWVTPLGFEINEGGDGEIHVYPATQKVVVEHNHNVVHQESESYEA